jgi:hypothetical protein
MERDSSFDRTVTGEGCFIRTVRLEGHEGEPRADPPRRAEASRTWDRAVESVGRFFRERQRPIA